MADRETVIYDIGRCICHVPDACKDCSKYGGDNAIRCMEELLADALTLLKAQEPGWISVKDRLPPANDLVIVSINDDRGDNDYRYTVTGWYLAEGKCWIVDNEATINVEAWMPLPKPYKPPKEET